MKNNENRWLHLARLGAVLVTALLLVLTVGFVVLEGTWVEENTRGPEEAFLYGTIGAELMPLPVFRVLPELFPEHFQPGGEAAGDWVDQFGFNRGTPDVNHGLPLGFSAAHYRPKSGSPSPVAFVGFSCGLCHTAKIRQGDGEDGQLLIGMGNYALDLFAWVEAVQSALLDERLTPEAIEAAYDRQYGEQLGPLEAGMVRLWLQEARSQVDAAQARYDEPYGGRALRDADVMLNGPGRTQPFRELVRLVLNRPAAHDHAFTKLPVLYHQERREWAQTDGSVRGPLNRSVAAALAAGSTMDNLVVEGIAHNVTQSNTFIADHDGPRWEDVFPDHPIDRAAAERGRAVYERHCDTCHGRPGDAPGTWVDGARQGEVVPLDEIGTDPERVNYRHSDVIADRIYEHFPEGHPLKPAREDLRPGPMGTTRGYINAPLEATFTRVPYLHNGSVPTLAQLINLEPRPDVFYRGRNLYDPEQVGLVAPAEPDARRYYRFDTAARGNDNGGHDFPWAYQGPGWNEAELRDLLEYLKTF